MRPMRFWEQPKTEPVNSEVLRTGTYATRQESSTSSSSSVRSHGTGMETEFTRQAETVVSIGLFYNTTSGQSDTTTGYFQMC